MNKPTQILNKIDLSELAKVVGRNNDTTIQAINELKQCLIALDNNDQSESNLAALQAMTRSLEALTIASKESYNTMARAVSEIKPEINFNPVIENKKDDTSYKFVFKRNSANMIIEAVVTPL